MQSLLTHDLLFVGLNSSFMTENLIENDLAEDDLAENDLAEND